MKQSLPDSAGSTAAIGDHLPDAGRDEQTHRPGPQGMSFVGAQPERRGWGFGMLFAAVLLAYVGIGSLSIGAPFFPLDDRGELDLVRVSSWSSLLGTDLFHFFRPVKNVLFAAYNWLFFHGGMVPVRTLAILIGLFSALAVFKLCCRVLASREWALGATAIWLLSPTLVASTAWLSASNILLMTGFAAMALICHDSASQSEEPASRNARKSDWLWTASALLWLILSLASYEGAVSLIPLFVAMDWYLRPQRLCRRSAWRKYLLYGLALVFYLILRHHAQSAKAILGDFSHVSRLEASVSSGYFTVLHFGIWIWPFNRMAVTDSYYWGQVSNLGLTLYAAIVLGAALFSVLLRPRHPQIALGIAWSLLAFAPMSNILGFRNGPFSDPYITLASVGTAIAFIGIIRALWLSRMTGSTRTAALATIALLIASRTAAVSEAAVRSYAWNDPFDVYERNLRTFPQSFDTMIELAKLYEARGDLNKAEELAAKAISIAPDRFGAYAVKAVVAEREGKIQDAMKWSAIYLGYRPSDSWGLTFRGDIYANHLGQPARAEELYREAIAQKPWTEDSLRAAYELAYMEAKQGHRADAISLWKQLLLYHPNDRVLHWDLSIAYAQEGDRKQAAYHLRLAQGIVGQPSIGRIPPRN
ncbi:MAG: tetratricopeptide repeat protein [Limisphaerales bacterium]